MPLETNEWLDLEDENTMLSPTMVEKGITPWECSNCPWWIEYPLGVIPKHEKDLHTCKLNYYMLIYLCKCFMQNKVFICMFPFGVHEVYLEKNPTAVKNLTIFSTPNDEVTQGIAKNSKKGSKGKDKLHVNSGLEDGYEDESEPPSLIRKKGKKSTTTTTSRSRVSESILDRPTSERRPAQRKKGKQNKVCIFQCVYIRG